MVARRLAGVVLGAFVGITSVLFSLHDAAAQQANSETFNYTELTIPDLRRIAWRPDGQVLAVAAGNEVVLYTSTLQEILHLEGHTDVVNSMSWSTDGRRLASGSDDTTVRIWDVDEISGRYGSVQTVLQSVNEVYTVSWNPDLAKNQLAAVVLDRVVWTSESAFVHVLVNIWDVTTGEIQHTLPTIVNFAPYLVWNSDGAQLLTSSLFPSGEYSIVQWNPAMGDDWRFFPPYLYRINALDLKGDSDVLAVGSEYDPLLLVDLDSQQILADIYLSAEITFTLNWSSDGAWLAVGGTENMIRIINAATTQVEYVLEGHEDDVYQVEWSPNENLLASIGGDHRLRIWELSSLPDISGIPTITPRPTLFVTATPAPSGS